MFNQKFVSVTLFLCFSILKKKSLIEHNLNVNINSVKSQAKSYLFRFFYPIMHKH